MVVWLTSGEEEVGVSKSASLDSPSCRVAMGFRLTAHLEIDGFLTHQGVKQ